MVYILNPQNNKVIYSNAKCIEEFGDFNGMDIKLVEKKFINSKHYIFKESIILWENNIEVKLRICIDITHYKYTQEKIMKLAYYDDLTKLANRVLFKEYLLQAAHNSIRTTHYHALLFIDLDDFKIINDKLGHHIGDKVLYEVAMRIKSCIRDNDIVARLGGDEFVVLIDTHEKERKYIEDSLINVINKILFSIENPYPILKNKFSISASIGIKLFNTEPSSIDELIIHADIAMYKAKSNGKNTFFIS